MTDELRAVVEAITRDAREARDAARRAVAEPYTAPAHEPDGRTTVNRLSSVDSQTRRHYR